MYRRSRIACALAFCIALLASMALPAAAQDRILLAAGDTIAFSVLGAPALDRQATIGADGAIYLPVAGKVAASGLDVDELRERVYTALRDRAYRVTGPGGEDVWRRLQEDELFLDVAAYRPVYVTGNVVNSGAVPFRPGLSVRQALAVAGGVGLFTGESSELQILRLNGERRLLVGNMEVQLTELERLDVALAAVLEQQSSGSGSPEAGGGPPFGDPPSELEQLARRWLDARAELRALTASSNELMFSRMESRLEVLEELDAVSQENLQFDTEEFARATEAATLRPWSSLTAAEARRGLLQSSTRALETASEVLRLKLDMERFSEGVKADVANEQIQLLQAISSGTANLQNLRQRLRTIDEQLVVLGTRPLTDQEPSIEMKVFRAASGATEGEDALPDTILAPGDVLEVTLAMPEAPSQVR